MSDDRFKQARRSLINQQARPQHAPVIEDYSDSEGSTQMVDLQALQAGAAAQRGVGSPFGAPADYGDSEGSTQMVDLQALQAGAAAQAGGIGGMSGGYGAARHAIPNYTDDGSTQMVDLQALHAGAAAQQTAANYSTSSGESTQFVDLNALAAGAAVSRAGSYGGTPIEQDPVLRQGYQFGPDGIQRFGEITLVFARNALGRDVVLKRVWEGTPEQMPTWLRDRILQLAAIQHRNLTRMNGLFAAGSGCWVELERPPGIRLTHLLQSGPQPMEKVAGWAAQVAEAISAVHGFGILYGNLTPDAVWVDERTGQVMLEPFDALAFELRGNLGSFGGPEMSMPPEQRPVTPASDVYSFAMVLIAALTGNPPDVTRVVQIQNKNLVQAIKAALYPDPSRRPVNFDNLLSSLRDGGKGATGALPVDPKLLAAGGVGLLLIVGMLVMGGGGGEQAAGAPSREQAAQSAARPEKREPPKPGVVVADARVRIETSFEKNPGEVMQTGKTRAEKKEPTDKELAEAAQERQKALRLIDESKTLQEKYREENYKLAFMALCRAVKLQGEMTTDDRRIWAELISNPLVYKYQQSYVMDVENRLTGANPSVTNAQLPYRQLMQVYPQAPAGKFFEANGKASIKIVEAKKKSKKKIAKPAEDVDEGEGSEE
jgi:serine/threonine protein kinase